MSREHASTEELRGALARDLDARILDWRLLGVRRGAVPYLLWQIFESLDRPLVILTANARAAEEVVAGLETMLGESGTRGFLGRRVHLFPAREAPPLEMVSSPVEVEAGRIAALYQLAQMRAPIVVASIDATALRTLPPAALQASALYLVVGDDIDLDEFVAKLTDVGYRRTGLVEEPGEVAVRGGIVDFWPPGSDYPCRVELSGDTIESIRYFDPGDQRSIGEADETAVLPASAFPVARLADPAVRRAVVERCNDLMLAAGERRQLDAQLSESVEFPGCELLVPYVYPDPAWLADYLPAGAVVAVVDPPAVEAAVDELFEQLADARAAAEDAGTFYPEVERLYATEAELRALIARAPHVELDLTETIAAPDRTGRRRMLLSMQGNEGVSAARAHVRSARGENRFRPMVVELSRAREGRRIVVLASDPTQLERLAHLLALNDVDGVERAETFANALAGSPERLWLVLGHLEEGFRYPADRLVVVTDEEIFGERRRPARRHKISRARSLSALTELAPGDYMVHLDHGIGIYRGLKHIVAGGTEGDFIHLEYAGGDRLYLPVDRINLVEKYTGAGAAPALARLGSQAWSRTKKKAKESILKLAHELLELEAFRAIHTRDAFARADADFEEFEAHFPFEETDDQKKAIRDVVRDLGAEKPMDRVVCGDVGYGKTEVALRAAYLTAVGGRQVAVLVPTTVLARQHFDTFRQRFDSYPICVEMLSRFQSNAENKRIVEGLRTGTIDIVVGTHRLLQRDVSFARLGLLVVDEEHRFGVKAKERLKQLRREVDVLTLTATPIPRTLQLALTGVRDLSLIETPPVDRLAIRTYVARYDEGLIKQAIERELTRGGQVFFVHNRVASIAGIAEKVRALVPKARVVVGHGQMNEGELERVMLGFLACESDVLVCTSIIESGLDIPNANTVLINRADAFGLAQLYQIRGRVGRSHRRAYAYLLVPGESIMTEDARQRLAVLQQLDDLGSGFRLAAHDMEIRGAGNLLGKEQSGQVAAVGFELFMQMMEETAAELRGTEIGPRIEPEIELGAEAFIPEGYIDDIGERLLLYKRMANAPDRSALGSIADELADRFGPLPRPVEDFVRVMALRPALKALAVESLKASEGTAALRFHEDSPVDRDLLVGFATAEPHRFRLRPAGVFTMSLAARSWHEMVDEIERFLDDLGRGSVRCTGKAGLGEHRHAPIH